MHFMHCMQRHWNEDLRLANTPGLLSGWRQFDTAVADAEAGNAPWQILQLPTGSGKTQALKVLCSLTNPLSGPGILIVTKFKQEADNIAAGVNQLARCKLAMAVHSDTADATSSFSNTPVLVITHAAYRLGLIEAANAGHSERLERCHRYHFGARQLVVIDEAFDWVEAYRVNLADMRSMLGDIVAVLPDPVRRDARRLLELANALTAAAAQKADRRLGAGEFGLVEQTDFVALAQAIANLPERNFAQWADGRSDNTTAEEQLAFEGLSKARYQALLSDIRSISQIGFVWTSNRRGKAELHSSRNLMDVCPRPGIILDATASIDPVYQLMGDRVRLLSRPAGIRSYASVTLHVSSGHAVGKEHLTEHAASCGRKLLDELRPALAGRKTLFCTHKDVKEDVAAAVSSELDVHYVHWGNIDGRNDWKDCDSAVFLGLPYLDDIVPTNAFFAFKGPQQDEWFGGSRRFGAHRDIRKSLKDGFIAKSLIQAINRTRCRSPVGPKGDCEPTSIYLLLPDDETGRRVRTAIVEQMPGVQVMPWQSSVARRTNSKTAMMEQLVALMARTEIGTYLKSWVVQQLGANSRTFERITAELRKSSASRYRLSLLGVQYQSACGRGNEARFVKSAI